MPIPVFTIAIPYYFAPIPIHCVILQKLLQTFADIFTLNVYVNVK